MPDQPAQDLVIADAGGNAPVLNYKVPESTSYSGRQYLELEFEGNPFVPLPPPPQDVEEPIAEENLTPEKLDKMVSLAAAKRIAALGSSIAGSQLGFQPVERVKENLLGGHAKSEGAFSTIVQALKGGNRIRFQRNLAGNLRAKIVPPLPKERRPRLFLIETYRITSFGGDYGAGKRVKSFTLGPNESVTITSSSYKQTEEQVVSASSVLDSFNETTANEFEDSIQRERTKSKKAEENSAYHTEGEADANYGFGSAKVKGSKSGSTAAAREEFAKNISSAMEKHCNTASAKREIEISVNKTSKMEQGEKQEVVRHLHNSNLSRTLNIVCPQMNQAYSTITHLVDARIGYFDGFDDTKREAALYELDDLLSKVVQEGKVAEVKEAILAQLTKVRDYTGKQQLFVTPMEDDPDVPERERVYRVNPKLRGKYKGHMVPGVIVAANEYVLRTEDWICDAVLGQGEALDAFNRKKQDQSNRADKLRNDALEAEVMLKQKLLTLLEAGETEKASILAKLYSQPQPKQAEEAKGE